MANVQDYGAKGDGKSDDTAALTHAIQKGDGRLNLHRGDYLITRPLLVPLETHGRITINGQGGLARLIMAGAGPALHLAGSHRKSALPASVHDKVWDKERLPMVTDLEIVGRHAEADGIRIEGAMQPTLRGVLIRRCRHGIHLTGVNRNVLIADCHIYDLAGVGVFLDRLNLHQIIVHGCHISYCKRGGIQVAASEIRNFQIDSNDIEYNFDAKADTSADILLDARAGTIREGTIVGNTIQAVQSPGGANIRFLGAGQANTAVGMFAISGNLIGSQETAIHLQSCRGVVVAGNSMYNGYRHSLLVEDSEHIVIGANSIDHNSDYKGQSTDQIVFRNCRNVAMTGLVLQHTNEPTEAVAASVDVADCDTVSMTGCHILGARVRGVRVTASKVIRIADSTIRPRDGDATYQQAIDVDAKSAKVMIVNNFLAQGSAGELTLPKEVGTATGNAVI